MLSATVLRCQVAGFLTIGQREGLHVKLVAGTQTRFGEELVHGHDKVPLGHTTHPVQHLLNSKR